MQTENWPIENVKPYPGNPRRNDAAVDAVAASIREFGFRQPIVVDADGVIVAGHTRLKAAQRLEMTTVPVHVARDLTPAQARALRLADNKAGERSTWNAELLAMELADVAAADIDAAAFGFDLAVLDAMAAGNGHDGAGKSADDTPEPDTTRPPITQPGDLWTLGEHRLLCGDSTSAADVERLLDGEVADLCATDPPYVVDYTGERPNDTGKDWTANYREIDITDAGGFFTAVFANVARVVKPHGAIYCWHAHKRSGMIQAAWETLGIAYHQQIVWVKPTAVFGRVFWHFRHEPCLVGYIGRADGDLGPADGDSVWAFGWEGGKSKIVGNEHPTQKPVEIFARPMRRHTTTGALCFEPFSGSGSQLIAGEQEGRRVRAMELSPVFVDVAVRRWEAFTGRKATRVNAAGRRQRGMTPIKDDAE